MSCIRSSNKPRSHDQLRCHFYFCTFKWIGLVCSVNRGRITERALIFALKSMELIRIASDESLDALWQTLPTSNTNIQLYCSIQTYSHMHPLTTTGNQGQLQGVKSAFGPTSIKMQHQRAPWLTHATRASYEGSRWFQSSHTRSYRPTHEERLPKTKLHRRSELCTSRSRSNRITLRTEKLIATLLNLSQNKQTKKCSKHVPKAYAVHPLLARELLWVERRKWTSTSLQ